MITIYHNPRCKKSRAGLQYLQEKNVQFEVREYLKDPLSEKELKGLLGKLGRKPDEIVRTQEDLYKKEYRGKDLSDGEWVSILVENPKLIQRPIVEKGKEAVIGDPAENIGKIL